MATKTIKPNGGSNCAVATCIYNASKAKRDGKQISFHRFHKNIEIRKQWTLKCKRKDNWNLNTSYICSNHFCESNFVHDLKAELMGNYCFVFYLVIIKCQSYIL
ncbi:peroxynitrite isomerase THAP4-like [Aphis gossypii]|uniref:peroxynitrite isomerase THAP4-like n=1 Tax=Aphis gossypii TaxID=80765 RepID=UPI002158DD54|nr:peroxynitrite isomerase THAP4-like [Aphis gossypii]